MTKPRNGSVGCRRPRADGLEARHSEIVVSGRGTHHEYPHLPHVNQRTGSVGISVIFAMVLRGAGVHRAARRVRGRRDATYIVIDIQLEGPRRLLVVVEDLRLRTSC